MIAKVEGHAIDPSTENQNGPDENNLGWIFFLCCVLLAAFKLWMVGDDEIIARNAPHDQLWFIRIADSLIQGKWLGELNELTFLRQPGYPLWISWMNRLGISLRIGSELSLILSATLFSASLIKANLPRWLGVAAFALIIFHPVSLSLNNEVEGETLYLPMLLLALGGMNLMLASRNGAGKYMASALTALSLAVLWNTREENLLIAGGYALFGMIFLLTQRRRLQRNSEKNPSPFLLLLIPVMGILVANLAIRAKNYQEYGEFRTSKALNLQFLKDVRAESKGWTQRLAESFGHTATMIFNNRTEDQSDWASPAVQELFDKVARRNAHLLEPKRGSKNRVVEVNGWFLSVGDPLQKVLVQDLSGREVKAEWQSHERVDITSNLAPQDRLENAKSGFMLRANFGRRDPRQGKLTFILRSGKQFKSPILVHSAALESASYSIDGMRWNETHSSPQLRAQEMLRKIYPKAALFLVFAGFMGSLLLVIFRKSITSREIIYGSLAIIAWFVVSRALLFWVLHISSLPYPPTRYLYAVMGLFSCLCLVLFYLGIRAFSLARCPAADDPRLLTGSQL